MPAIATIGTPTIGLDGPSTIVAIGSPNVVAQGLAVSCIGDLVYPHVRYGDKNPHGRVIAVGSSTVVVNGLAVAYQGSLCTCGDIVGPSPVQTVEVAI